LSLVSRLAARKVEQELRVVFIRIECAESSEIASSRITFGEGGTGKAEAVKLPDAGISLKPCPDF
jgi:hypothetical protein